MSTPSKKRRQARAWMKNEYAQREIIEERARREGIFRGREQMAKDARKLLPEPDRTYNNERGGQDVVQVIKKFPSPYEGMSVFRVPMPSVTSLSRDRFAFNRMAERVEFIDFRPIEHALTVYGDNCSSSLRWFTWEPARGDEEVERRTKALFTGMGKLAYVARTLDHMKYAFGGGRQSCSNCGQAVAEHRAFGELQRASELLTECADELRLRLGKFAPEENLHPQTADYRYGRAYPYPGQRLF